MFMQFDDGKSTCKSGLQIPAPACFQTLLLAVCLFVSEISGLFARRKVSTPSVVEGQ